VTKRSWTGGRREIWLGTTCERGVLPTNDQHVDLDER